MLFPFAYTVAINPPSANPTLTKDEVWEGLIKKAHKPQDYVPVIDHCEVLSEDENGLVRNVNIKPGFFLPEGPVREEVSWVEKIRITYVVGGDNPGTITNVLSEGGPEGELYLTTVFELSKDVEPGSQEETQTWALLYSGARKSIENVVKFVREKKASELF